MNTEQVAQKVVELTRKQAWHEALDTLYAKDIVSVRGARHGFQEANATVGGWRVHGQRWEDRARRVSALYG